MADIKALISAIRDIDPQVLKDAGLTAGHIQSLVLQLPRATPKEIAQIVSRVERLVKADLRKKAAKNYLAFLRYVRPGLIEGAHIRQMGQVFDDIVEGRKRRLIINMPPRHPLALDTPILTTSGWKTMATVEVGDFVFTPSGRSALVTGKSPIYRDVPLYRAVTDDGASITCDGAHLWPVSMCRKRRHVIKAKRADELATRSGRKPRLIDALPIEWPDANLPVDPYALGVWLGDGSTYQATITMHPDDQPVVRSRIDEAHGTVARKDPMTFGIDGIRRHLIDLGILGGKRIPDIYLRASVAQRLALLDGLMDTDGSVSADRQCFLATSSPILRDQYRELLWSLGIKNSAIETDAIGFGRNYGKAWKIAFYARDIGTLPRKRERALGHVRETGRYLSVEATGEYGDVQCISVDSPDHLFLAGHGMVPTHNSKSENASYYFPAYYIGRYPDRKIMIATHTADLATDFGRKIRNLMQTKAYQDVFPGVTLAEDSKSQGKWNTSQLGEFYAAGVGSSIAGRGAHLFIMDDPTSEQQAKDGEYNSEVWEKSWQWYLQGPRQRLQPGAAILLVQTRWNLADMTGKLLEAQKKAREQWHVIRFPAILPSGRLLWPEFWKMDDMLSLQEELDPVYWAGQYMQDPTSDVAAIVTRKMWKKWGDKPLPEVSFTMTFVDTAHTKDKANDWTAWTHWGVFHNEETNRDELLLLEAYRDRMDYPTLKMEILKHFQEMKPDMVQIEAKASGMPLIQELRMMRLPVLDFTPTRATGDKIRRLRQVVDIFTDGLVHVPDRGWADEVVEEVAQFPRGTHDDFTDTVSMALRFFRAGDFIRTQMEADSEEDEEEDVPSSEEAYY